MLLLRVVIICLAVGLYGLAICDMDSFIEFNMVRVFGRKSNKEGPNNGEASQVMLLVQYVIEKYLDDCSLIIFHHSSFKFGSREANFELVSLLHTIKVPFAHGMVKRDEKPGKTMLEPKNNLCRSFIIFCKDIAVVPNIVGNQTTSKVVVITSSSRWKIQEMLTSPSAKGIINLLVIATTGTQNVIIRKGERSRTDRFLNMYSHELFVDGAGSSEARLIASWKGNKLSRNLTLFPPKMKKGFNGRQFTVVGSEQAPYTVKKNISIAADADTTALWDGLEIRLLQLIGSHLNFTIQITEADPLTLVKGPAEVVIENVQKGLSEIGAGGAYVAVNRLHLVSMSAPHSIDCAAFVVRTSTALPRYRAILGPFQLSVWLALTFIYMLAIIPLTFAEKHSLRYLTDNPWHIETMFWYVFGTFTNLFTFRGDNSWTRSDKNATRILIGGYWAFSIIVTACYTGSIIAFITLFEYPASIDSVERLYEDGYRVGSLSTGGWGTWFNNSDDPRTLWLLRDIELVPNVALGLLNITKSFYLPLFRPYTFLGSRAQLEYTIRTNYSLNHKKVVLHVTRECFAPFSVSFVYPKGAPYVQKMNEYILRAQQSGLISKLLSDMRWDLERSRHGKRLQAQSGATLREAIQSDRQLSLDDTQGIFLLLGAGFLIAIAFFISETLQHRQKAKLSFRFWKWRPKIVTGRLWEIVRRHFLPETLMREKLDNEFTYKKYDSRVLNSQYQGVSPHCFPTKAFVIQEGGLVERTTSLPGLGLQVPISREALKLSTSLHLLPETNSSQREKWTETVPQASRMRFGSVGSVLHFDCRHVFTQKYLADRPMTSIN